MVRDVIISDECAEYLSEQGPKVAKKFAHIFTVIQSEKVVGEPFVKNLVNTDFYEIIIKTNNQHRIITFALDNDSFIEATKVILLYGFTKKNKKDYKKAIKRAANLLNEYQNECENESKKE